MLTEQTTARDPQAIRDMIKEKYYDGALGKRIFEHVHPKDRRRDAPDSWCYTHKLEHGTESRTPQRASEKLQRRVQAYYNESIVVLCAHKLVLVVTEEQAQELEKTRVYVLTQKKSHTHYGFQVCVHPKTKSSAQERIRTGGMSTRYTAVAYLSDRGVASARSHRKPAMRYGGQLAFDFTPYLQKAGNPTELKMLKKSVLSRAYREEKYTQERTQHAQNTFLKEIEHRSKTTVFYSQGLRGYTAYCKAKAPFVGYDVVQMRPFETREEAERFLQGRKTDYTQQYKIIEATHASY